MKKKEGRKPLDTVPLREYFVLNHQWVTQCLLKLCYLRWFSLYIEVTHSFNAVPEFS
jgi:hypothetical protein